jgi:MerR family redox-sensitive transcriptional activator SoxR
MLSIGEVAERAGVSTSALRFYERHGLLAAHRTEAGHRRYPREVLRRIAFIRVAQRVGLSLSEIAEALDSLPDSRTPNQRDWARLSGRWRARLNEQMALLQGLRDQLTSCIGCGCLSFTGCRLYNPRDAAAQLGAGPRYLLGDSPDDLTER